MVNTFVNIFVFGDIISRPMSMFFHFVYKNLFKCNFYYSKHLGDLRVLGVEIRKYSLSVTKIQGNLILKLAIRSEVGVGVINCLASSLNA